MSEKNWEFIALGWQGVAATRQDLIEQLKVELRQARHEVARLSLLSDLSRITRVDILNQAQNKEFWADSWVGHILDEGRTLKLYGSGTGADANRERNESLSRDLASFGREFVERLGYRYCNGCGSAFPGDHECMRK